MWSYEKKAASSGFFHVAGLDEAGRGPLAGPVVASAVILPESFNDDRITDSKKLTPKKRDELFDVVYDHALSVGVGVVDHVQIDSINILQASLLAMQIAVKHLTHEPDYLLIDGIFQIDSHLPQEAIKKGDSLSISIAAASIIAKVTRDRMMLEYDALYPQYGFAKHKGYPTKAHKEAVSQYGVCPIHRKTFKGVKEFCL